jgi:DNA-binding SARP family transcriptional activator
VINFEVLGNVRAREGDWTAGLTRMHQTLLARLVMAGGAPVSTAELSAALWDETESPDGGLKRVVSELRTRLQAAPSASAKDPLPFLGGGYRLRLDRTQADVLRFQDKVTAARNSTEEKTVQLMREALQEWGNDAASLYGGDPLSGLDTLWANGVRVTLRHEYRDARFHCLRQAMRDRQYDRLAWECDRLADDQDSLHDEAFIELSMRAAYLAGHTARAMTIFHRASESASRHLGISLSDNLHRLLESIQSEDPRLGPRADLDFLNVPTSANDRKPMSDSGTVFNNSGPTTIGQQIGVANGDCTVNMPAPPAADEVAEESDDQEK